MPRDKSALRIVKQALGLLLLVGAYSFFYLVFYNLLSSGEAFPKTRPITNLIDYTYNFIPVLILTVCDIFIVFRLWNNSVVEKYLPVKVIADFIVAFAVLYLVNKLYVLVAVNFHLNPRVDWVGSVLCNILLIMGIEIVYYVRRSRDALRRAEYIKRESIQYQYDALKAQINPHFLFNALNMQVSLISLDPEKAIEYTSRLSDIYRYILTIQNKTRIPVAQELEFLDSYLSILEMRYRDNLRVKIRRSSNISGKYTVPYVLQLLMENVTKHNVVSAKYPMEVEVVVGEHCITVTNPVNRKENHSSNGIGLKYIAQQFAMHGREFEFGNDGRVFTAKIPYL